MDIDIEDNGDGTFSIYYTVKDAGEYTLSIKFGGQPVPEGVYNFTVSPMQLSRIIHFFCGFGSIFFLGRRWDNAT
jgi:filamin